MKCCAGGASWAGCGHENGPCRRMFVVFTVFAAFDRTWEYLLPLMLSRIVFDRRGDGHGDMASGVVSGSAGLYLARTSVEIVAMPIAAKFWLGTPGHACKFLACKSAFLMASAMALRALQSKGAGNTPLLQLLAVCGFALGIESSLAKTLWNAVEKQQAFVESISGDADGAQLRLATTNAALSRIDLVVAALAPFFVTAASSLLGPDKALIAIVVVQLVGNLAVAPLLMRMLARPPELSESETGTDTAVNDADDCPDECEDQIVGHDDRTQRGVAKLISAQALLYFDVVTPGGLLVVWLREQRLPEASLATFVSLAQLCGAVGSWIPTHLLHTTGVRLEDWAVKIQTAHAAAIIVAAVAVGIGHMYALILATLLSRIALWAIYLVGRQVSCACTCLSQCYRVFVCVFVTYLKTDVTSLFID